MTTADVVGTVKDSSGAVVPDAKVTIRLTSTQETRVDKTGAQGQFRFSLLQPGSYTISAESPGLKSDIERLK
jgi:protocatechuate 3,4-dioxygenase beta subunit